MEDFEPECNFKPKLDDSGVYTGEEATINDNVYKPIASVTMHQNAFTNETHYTFQCKRNSDGYLVYNGMNVKMKNAPELWNLRGCKVVV